MGALPVDCTAINRGSLEPIQPIFCNSRRPL